MEAAGGGFASESLHLRLIGKQANCDIRSDTI